MKTATHAESILHQVAAGTPGAMDACMEKFSGLVWSLTRQLSFVGSDADDAVQEIFIDIWKRVTELSCVEISELIKTPFFKRGKIGAVMDDVVIGQELLLPRPCVFAPR